MKKYIPYYRVSTKKQFLGLEAQQNDVESFVKAQGGILLPAYTEKESATRKSRHKRIELRKALNQCNELGATLLVAKIDRLTRDVEFLYNIKNSGVKFQSVDVPDMDELTVGVMAVIAEAEAKRIRQRIVSALDAKRRKGEVLGNSNITTYRNKAVKNSVKVRSEIAKIDNSNAMNLICEFRSVGKTFQGIASILNKSNITTSKGNPFVASTVCILHKRYC